MRSESRMAASSSMTRIRDFDISSAVFEMDRSELTLTEIGGVHVQRQDLAGVDAAHNPAVVGHRFDVLPVDFEEDASAVDAPVESRAHRLDASDQHAARVPGQVEAVRRLPIQIAHVE